MKCIWLLLIILPLTGCAKSQQLDPLLALRQQLLCCNSCCFQAQITADYGEHIYTFTMDCTMDAQGCVRFVVAAPESISGITGSLSANGGALTFDEQMLAFELMAGQQLSPVSAPYILLKTLRSGYIRACGEDGDLLIAQIDDSYEEDPLSLDIWLDRDSKPVYADILYRGMRFLSISIKSFEIL